ncbi:hypothetical protein Tco_0738078, partial [Tanacetum coccineum]
SPGAQQLSQPSLHRWRGTDPPFSSAIRDHALNQTSCADSYGLSLSFRTRERTSPENQISSQVHAQFNATTVDTTAGTNAVAPQSLNTELKLTTYGPSARKSMSKLKFEFFIHSGYFIRSNDWCFDRPRTESGFVRVIAVEQFLVLFFPLRFPHLHFFCGTLMIPVLDAFFTWKDVLRLICGGKLPIA